jgi:hypothetical protein
MRRRALRFANVRRILTPDRFPNESDATQLCLIGGGDLPEAKTGRGGMLRFHFSNSAAIRALTPCAACLRMDHRFPAGPNHITPVRHFGHMAPRQDRSSAGDPTATRLDLASAASTCGMRAKHADGGSFSPIKHPAGCAIQRPASLPHGGRSGSY